MFAGDNPALKNYNGNTGMGFPNGNAKATLYRFKKR
jgi:hypothetical protein